MTKCDLITRAQCPHAAYCEPFAVYTDESECAKFAQWVLNKPVTNADRIRAMSDKELASFKDRQLHHLRKKVRQKEQPEYHLFRGMQPDTQEAARKAAVWGIRGG